MGHSLRALSPIALAALFGLAWPGFSSAADFAPVAAPATYVPPSKLPAPDPTTSGAAIESDYHIGPTDLLDITVFQVDELTRSVEVNTTGNISLPLIGQITASGKTPEQLQTEIADKLSHFVRSPQVTVYVKEAKSQKFTVEGSVTQPGVYPITGRTTLIQALATAHGTDRFAKLNRVVIFRTINGQMMASAFNIQDIRDGKYPDPEVYGNDVIEVEINGPKRTLYDFVEMSPLFYMLRP